MSSYHFLKVNLFILITSGFLYTYTISQEIPSGPYFSQEPPGMEPEIFTAGIISLPDRFEQNITFAPDGHENIFVTIPISPDQNCYLNQLNTSNALQLQENLPFPLI